MLGRIVILLYLVNKYKQSSLVPYTITLVKPSQLCLPQSSTVNMHIQ